MGKVIAVCNQKGGTGKTTTVVNVAAYLVSAGKRVLIVDLDPQANATSGVGIDKCSVVQGSYNILTEEPNLSEIILPTIIEKLKIIPANVDLTGAEVELVGRMGREYRLKKVLDSKKDEYNYILIDSPPSLGLLTINALCAADSVLIPVQCEYYALEGLAQLVNTIKLVRENLNPNLRVEGVVLTMADFRTNLTTQVIDEVKKFFEQGTEIDFGQKTRVYNAIIPRNIRLTEAPSFGKPIALYDCNSIGAQKYQELTNELIGSQPEQLDKVPQGTEEMVEQGE